MRLFLIATIAGTFAFGPSSAQKHDKNTAPAAVQAAFKAKFPKGENVEWEKENANYEAEFMLDNQEYSAVFNEAGNLLETEKEIKPEQLPEAVINYVKSNYPNSKIKEAAEITDAAGQRRFEVEIKGFDLLFTEQGKFIEKVAQ